MRKLYCSQILHHFLALLANVGDEIEKGREQQQQQQKEKRNVVEEWVIPMKKFTLSDVLKRACILFYVLLPNITPIKLDNGSFEN